MVPVESTFRIRLLFVSAMKRLPLASSARPVGRLSSALNAPPPSPLKPGCPVPANAMIVPFVSKPVDLMISRIGHKQRAVQGSQHKLGGATAWPPLLPSHPPPNHSPPFQRRGE